MFALTPYLAPVHFYLSSPQLLPALACMYLHSLAYLCLPTLHMGSLHGTDSTKVWTGLVTEIRLLAHYYKINIF